MSDSVKGSADGHLFVMRLKFWSAKRIGSEDASMPFSFQGKPAVLTAVPPAGRLCDSDDLEITVKDLASEADAWSLAHALRESLLFASAASRHGIRLEPAASTGGPTDHGRKFVKDQTGLELARRVGGVSVFPDTGRVLVVGFKAGATVSVQPEEFINLLGRAQNELPTLSRRARAALGLLNAAVAAGHPLASTVLAVSAVESLVEDRSRPESQVAWIDWARGALDSDTSVSENDRSQLTGALANLRRRSVGKGVSDLLDEVGVADDVGAAWRRMYKDRSDVIHGRRVGDEVDLGALATAAVPICAHIVLAVVVADGTELPAEVARGYPLLT